MRSPYPENYLPARRAYKTPSRPPEGMSTHSTYHCTPAASLPKRVCRRRIQEGTRRLRELTV